jgi:hypothetical protein
MRTHYQPKKAVILSAIALTLTAESAALASTSIRGSIAGRVFDAETQQLVPDVTVGVAIVSSGESFQAVTDGNGTYHVAEAPAAVYSFTLRAGGVDFPVRDRMDLRVSMPFILESCFELDRTSKAARVRAQCESGFVEQARVATIGPHRFLLPEDFQETQPAASDLPSKPTAIQHTEIDCLAREYFPQVDAAIPPGAQVQTSRVYFRSDKYPDFYWVAMTTLHPTIDDFQALIPKPGPETERIIYYLESVDLDFDNLQTQEYAPEVIEADECRKRGTPAWYTGENPSIVVGATQPGAAAIPPGFSALGITGFVNSLGVLSTVGGATAGGVLGSTGAILVVGGGAAAVATGIAIAAAGDEASPPNPN